MIICKCAVEVQARVRRYGSTMHAADSEEYDRIAPLVPHFCPVAVQREAEACRHYREEVDRLIDMYGWDALHEQLCQARDPGHIRAGIHHHEVPADQILLRPRVAR